MSISSYIQPEVVESVVYIYMLFYEPIPLLWELIWEIIDHRSGMGSSDADHPHGNQLVKWTSNKNNCLCSADWLSEGVAVGVVSLHKKEEVDSKTYPIH